MSLMNTELYNALRHAQVPEDLAEAAAQSVVSPEGLATKTAIAALQTTIADKHFELIKWMVGLTLATLLAVIGTQMSVLVCLP